MGRTLSGVDRGLDGRRALVTAASKGLGRACAEALIGEKARGVLPSRTAEAGGAAGREIGAHRAVAADVSKEADVEGLVGTAARDLGGLDILVVNAGGPPPGTFQTTPLDGWDKAYQLTLMSAVRLATAALPHLKKSDQGRIVVITSISVRQPIPRLVLSNSLRAAGTGLAKTLCLALPANLVTGNRLA